MNKKEIKFDFIEVKNLIPYIRNAKIHSEDQIKTIMASIREFGFLAPIIIDKENNILAGHGRLLAAERLGLEKVPCVQESHLTETQKKAYILADNRISELATWDEELLKLELEELKDVDFDLDISGFDEKFLSNFLDDEVFENTNRELTADFSTDDTSEENETVNEVDEKVIKCPSCGFEFKENEDGDAI